jgi:inhibitor of cysteine peptidase
MRALLLLLAGLGFARAVVATDPPAPVVVTIADEGKTIELKPGQALQIVLDANRTTGFSWSVEKIDTALLSLVGQPVYTTDAKPGVVGVGGTETWNLLAVGAGEQALKFVYRRSFEPNVSPARVFSFNVRIRS